MNTQEIPLECKSTVYMAGGIWLVREPKQKKPRYVLAEQLTQVWCVTQNIRAVVR